MYIEAETLIKIFREESEDSPIMEYAMAMGRMADKLQKMIDNIKESKKGFLPNPFEIPEQYRPVQVGPPPKTLAEWAEEYKKTGKSPWNQPADYPNDKFDSILGAKFVLEPKKNFLTKEVIEETYQSIKKAIAEQSKK
jgi:hypothetical protein